MMPAADPGGGADIVEGAEPTASERDALIALVRARHGAGLTAEQLDDLTRAIDAVLDNARALRAVKLDNGDEPAQPFAPFRPDS